MALTTLANVKDWMKITGVDAARDATLTRLIEAASTHIEEWLGRIILSGSYVETFDGNGGYKLLLPNYPITAVTQVLVGTTVVPLSVGNGFGYVFNSFRIGLIGYRFEQGIQNVKVSYTAGYATVPADIEQAAIELVSLRYKESDRIGITSKGLAGETISFTQRDFTKSVEMVLQQHRKVVPI